MTATDLPPFVQSLLRSKAYPHATGKVSLAETHISWVLLAGDFVYKLKKPVDFGFLDYTTFEKRAADCEEEVRLNRRLCPTLYLGVVDIVERDGEYFVGGEGKVIERAVHMRRMPEEGMLPTLLEARAVSPALVRRIARKVAQFHAKAATGPEVDEYGSVEAVRANWDENIEQMAPALELTGLGEIDERIREYVRRFLSENALLLALRVEAGRIREGHGDLHASSICVDGREIHLYDCIAFNRRFRCVDVAAEAAFLAMDLEHYGRADLAAAFVYEYVKESGDEELRLLLDFYVCYRAYVRGKIRALRLGQESKASAEERERALDEVRAYFQLAWSHTGALEGPVLVVSMGPPASGKTTLAESLAGRLGFVHVSSDVVRKELAGVAATEQRTSKMGTGLYTEAATVRTYATMRRRAAKWLGEGRSVILDATYGSADERARLKRVARDAGVPLLVLECRVDEATIEQRLKGREKQKGVVSDARVGLMKGLLARYSVPVEMDRVLGIDTSVSPAKSAERALELIRAEVGEKSASS